MQHVKSSFQKKPQSTRPLYIGSKVCHVYTELFFNVIYPIAISSTDWQISPGYRLITDGVRCQLSAQSKHREYLFNSQGSPVLYRHLFRYSDSHDTVIQKKAVLKPFSAFNENAYCGEVASL